MMSNTKTVYIHNIHLSMMREIEEHFQQYLNILCAHANDMHASPTQPTSADVIERKIGVTPHNTIKEYSKSDISLAPDSQKVY